MCREGEWWGREERTKSAVRYISLTKAAQARTVEAGHQVPHPQLCKDSSSCEDSQTPAAQAP